MTQERHSRSYYCAGAIRGNTSHSQYLETIVKIVSRYGEPYTERSETYVPLYRFTEGGSVNTREKRIYERDMSWLRRARALIAEVSGASTGTGFEIREAIALHKPVLCLYEKSSSPSLIVKQNTSQYMIVQQYSDERDLAMYLTLFLEIVSRGSDLEQTRLVYKMFESEILSGVDIRSLTDHIASLFIARKSYHVDVGLRNTEEFIAFMFKNLILQTRWDRLRYQRVGNTFISGGQIRIIRALAEFTAPEYYVVGLDRNGDHLNSFNLARLYRRLGSQRLGYSHKSFSKIVNAYRKVGLLAPFGAIAYAASSPKEDVNLVAALDGRVRVMSNRSAGNFSRSTVAVTKHILQLSTILGRIGAGPIVSFLLRFRMTKWYTLLADSKDLKDVDIDRVEVDKVLQYRWARQLVDYLVDERRTIGA